MEKTKLHWTLPLRVDQFGIYILDANGNMVAQLRGWGHLTGVGGLRLSEDEAIDVQKLRGSAIVDAVNALVKRDA